MMRNMRKWSLIAGLAAAMQFTVVCDLPDEGSIAGIDYEIFYDNQPRHHQDDDCWWDCDDDDWDFDFDWFF